MKIKQPDFQAQEATPQAQPVNLSQNRAALEEAAQAMRSFQQAGRSIEGIVGNIIAEKRKVDQATQLGAASVNAETDYLTQKEEFDRSNPNPDTYAEDIGKIYDKSVSDQMNLIKDRQVQAAFTISSQHRKMQVMNHAFTEENDLWLSTQKASKWTQVDVLHKLGVSSPTDEQAQEYKTGMLAVIRSTSGNLLKADQAVLLEQTQSRQFDQERDKYKVGLARSEILGTPNGPNDVNQIMNKYNIADEHRGVLMREAEIETGRRFRIEQENRLRINRETDSLFFGKAFVPGIAAQQGPLTIGEINNSQLDIGDKLRWQNILVNSVKPTQPKTDPAFATNLLDKILSGNTAGVRATILGEMAKDPDSNNPPRLSGPEANALLSHYYHQQTANKDHYFNDIWFKTTVGQFKSSLGFTEVAGLDQLQEEINLAIKGGEKAPKKNMGYFYDSLTELMRTVEKKNLHGEDIYKAGMGILNATLERQKQESGKKQSPMPGAQLAPDGKWYLPDPKRTGKYLRVD